MAEKLVVHLVSADKSKFEDVTHEIGKVNELSAVELAKQLAAYAKNKNIDVSRVVAECVN